jgi:transcription initiation factor TFIIB
MRVTRTSARKINMWSTFDADRAATRAADRAGPLFVPDSDVAEDTDAAVRCSECSTVYIIGEHGFPTCPAPECGAICKTVVDHAPEWRFYSAEDKNATDPTRCGAPINPLLPESSFGCKILCDSRSSYEMKKIRKWTEWMAVPHKEKSLYEEFQFISIMARNAGISKIFIDHAMAIHKDISEQKMFRGMNRDGIKSASIYIACRLNGCPRTAREIAEIFHMDKQSASAGCSNAINILQNVERNVDHGQKSVLSATTSDSFIERFCSKLGVPPELGCLATFVALRVEKLGVAADNTPQAVAAGIIFLITTLCNIGITKRAIRTACGVSEVTINKCYNKLLGHVASLIPDGVIDKYKRV